MRTWSLDPADSEIEFAVKHMMVTTVRGQFRKFSAEVDFDEARPERSSVVAHIDASSIETGMEARDAVLGSTGSGQRIAADYFATHHGAAKRAGLPKMHKGELPTPAALQAAHLVFVVVTAPDR